ncbi:MAG TPA: glyoxylate/hydroxypyruvate reductase A [Burkholderiaceae bacterium]|nr:glyoxylate/hydroxypyruvate reductase A [Burkholderiaceae bacterium]
MAVLLLTKPTPPAALAKEIRAIDPSIVCFERLDDADLAQVDAIQAWRLREGLAPTLPKLRLVCSTAAGVEKLLAPDLPEDVAIARTVDPRVKLGLAQYVALMALRHSRELPLYERQARERDWTRRPVDAAAHRVGILGVGETGTAIAAALSALGFAVHGWSTRPRPELPFPTRGADELQAFVADSDILVCALPLTPATEGIIDAKLLSWLPQGACLINVARGEHVVEPDLIEALGSGRLAGAALDVQRNEPLPPGDPLWGVDRITITPHIAGQASLAVVASQFVEAYQAMRSGDPIPRQVDKAKGY